LRVLPELKNRNMPESHCKSFMLSNMDPRKFKGVTGLSLRCQNFSRGGGVLDWLAIPEVCSARVAFGAKNGSDDMLPQVAVP
jgi:hypothetical protein